jgi:hypothetical protein
MFYTQKDPQIANIPESDWHSSSDIQWPMDNNDIGRIVEMRHSCWEEPLYAQVTAAYPAIGGGRAFTVEGVEAALVFDVDTLKMGGYAAVNITRSKYTL